MKCRPITSISFLHNPPIDGDKKIETLKPNPTPIQSDVFIKTTEDDKNNEKLKK